MQITSQKILNFIFNPDEDILFYGTIFIGLTVLTVAIIEGPGRGGPPPKFPKKRKSFPVSTKIKVVKEQGHICKACGKFSSTLDFDHIDGNRENNCKENCQALCPNCHAEKTRKRAVDNFHFDIF